MSSPPYNHILNRIKTPNTPRPRASSGASAVSFTTLSNDHSQQEQKFGVVLSPKTTDLWEEIGRIVIAMCAGEGVSTQTGGGGVIGGVEGVNTLVSRYMKTRILPGVLQDISELLTLSLSPLEQKLADTDEGKLVPRLVEIWSFFFGNVLPYFQGAFLPLEIDLRTLSKTNYVVTRNMALTAFRDKVICTNIDRIGIAFHNACTPPYQFQDSMPRMLQMLCVLADLKTGDAKQECIEHVLIALRSHIVGLANQEADV